MSNPDAAGHGAGVIFVRGVMVRCGTNYLADLLLLHPDCDRAHPPVWEDFLLHDAGLLARYAEAVPRHWPRSWGIDVGEARKELLASLGAGLEGFLQDGTSVARKVAKTAGTKGLHLYPPLFGSSPLLLLVRDGRDVAESTMRSFGWSFERAVQTWTMGAAAILEFIRAHEAGELRCMLLRYEDILQDVHATMREVLTLVDLDPDRYDFEAASQMPVRGSSSFGRVEGPNWKEPVAKDSTFQPLERWRDWDAARHARFNWIAGEQMKALGYEVHTGDVPLPVIRQRLMDIGWQGLRAKLAAARLARSLRHP